MKMIKVYLILTLFISDKTNHLAFTECRENGNMNYEV